MRETFGSLLLTTKNYATDESTTSANALSDSETFFKKEINKAVRIIFDTLKNYRVQQTNTIKTVEDQQSYNLPANFDRLVTATQTVGGIAYPLKPVDSFYRWNQLNILDFSGNAIPQFIFIERDTFSIWPTPQEDDLDIDLTFNTKPVDMRNDDYGTGTVAVTNGDATVTGTDTVFTASMVGRWFIADDNGEAYRIGSYTSATSIELENEFEGTTDASSLYTIGESPEVPEITHDLIPWKAAAAYVAGPRRDPATAQTYLNYFWTGDFNNNSRRPKDAAGGLLYVKNKYDQLGRSSSALVTSSKRSNSRFDEVWSVELS